MIYAAELTPSETRNEVVTGALVTREANIWFKSQRCELRRNKGRQL